MPRMTLSDLDGFLPLTPVTFEILLAVAEAPRHGYDVMLAVERRTRGRIDPNPGTLYRALDRLVRQGLLDVTQEPVEEGGEPRRVFRLSGLGRRAAAAEAERMADQVGAARARGVLEGRGR
jgi:DNA-binding PadR family transcriptional regulator